jgi:bifunctional NMN adenylyltransferase/nudix hydrolase
MEYLRMSKYTLAAFIGRFAPFHNAHKSILKKSFEVADRTLVLLGSANAPRTIRTPFTWQEREKMIRESFNYDQNQKLIFEPIEDRLYNNTAWIAEIQSTVAKYERRPDKICLIGHKKDGTSFYLKLFPEWDSFDVKQTLNLSSTDIRQRLFTYQTYDRDGNYLENNMCEDLPDSVRLHLFNVWRKSAEFKELKHEWDFIQDYKKQWAAAPYPPIFTTVDSVVVQSGHIALVERKAFPGEGLIALPGGFLNQNETLLDGAIRELYEETKIKVPEPALRGSLVTQDTFDHPYRSSRGRTITTAFLFQLRDEEKLPKLKGSDDARRAFWCPLAEVKRDMMFEDHFDIIYNLTGRLDRPKLKN